MEKLFHLLSKADLSTVLLILLQNPTPAITFSFLFLSFIFLSTFFSLSTYKCASFPLFLKQNRKHLTWFSLLLRLLFYFSPSLDTKILHRIDSLTNLACLPPHFLTTSPYLFPCHELTNFQILFTLLWWNCPCRAHQQLPDCQSQWFPVILWSTCRVHR